MKDERAPLSLPDAYGNQCTPVAGEPPVLAAIRVQIRRAVELVLDEELRQALGAARHQRTGERAGYRNGRLDRLVVTEYGPTELSIPRGRLFNGDGSSRE